MSNTPSQKESVILNGLSLQEEWRCAWEAVENFRLSDGVGKFGRKQAMEYQFEGVDEPITIGVWRGTRGINVIRIGG